MNLCSDGHDEICHEGRECPACNAIAEKVTKIEELENRIQVLEDETESSQEMSDRIEQLEKDLQLTRDGQRDGQR